MSQQEKADFSKRMRNYREREGISQEELAKRLGISRNWISIIEGGREPSEQVVRHFALLESSPLPPGPAASVKESAPDYNLMKKVIFIEEEGSPEQLAMVDAFLDSVCERLGFPRGKKPDRSGDKPTAD